MQKFVIILKIILVTLALVTGLLVFIFLTPYLYLFALFVMLPVAVLHGVYTTFIKKKVGHHAL